ncbi:XrtY-associated glycosyltransferase XYAG1 [Hymenobacter sp. BT559]|uniref:XrtY-associated glycosyltransferase XYAG1 n=1 Tax=Hymenobacter sp. BT559 TaxID=2795729 RepID=UPI0018EC29F2|nr:glycosyltransferase [Hymenobacter sp. BT559]MBJ6144320.1 glycosyltransferase [Hymenobacter sp. BT559]
MRILLIVPSYKPAYIYGGPIVVIARLAETLAAMGHSVTVYTTTANGKTELPVAAGAPVLVDGVTVYYFKRVTGDHTHASPALWRHLGQTVKDFDIVHIHSWWNLLVIGAAWICRRHGITPIVSPHGMLSNYILDTNNSAKKKIVHSLIGKQLLKQSIVHVSTQLEWEESQAIIPGWSGIIIPNLVTLPQKTTPRVDNDIFTIGFLSRIDPKKGLDVLFKALSLVQLPYRLLVAGAGSEEYTKELQEIASATNIDNKIQWVGWKNGEAKFEFFAGLDLFALTSHSENFAIVVIEALATGTPVLISEQVGLYQFVRTHDYGWVTTLSPPEIAATIEAAILDKSKRTHIANVAPVAIRREFDDRYLAQQYLDFYAASTPYALQAS